MAMRSCRELMAVAILAVVFLTIQMTTAEGMEEGGAPAAAGKALGLGLHGLDEFGPIGTAAEATDAYEKGLQSLTEAGGGVLVIPVDAPENWRCENTAQWSREWQYGPGVLVMDLRSGGTGGNRTGPTVAVPQATGLTLNRTMRMPQTDSLPHWSYNPVLKIENNIVHGSNSYLDWLQEDVKAGQDRRFYVPTIRAIFPGMFINAHGGPGYGNPVGRLTVKAVGYDPEKKMHYFVADTPYDHPAGAIVHNKNHTNGLMIVTNANAANQTFDLNVVRNHYAHGDAYLVNTTFNYMGDIHSAAGDENGVCFAAFTHSKSNIFRATVDSLDWAENRLTYKGGQNEETVSNTRPLINLNPEKWITDGKVVIQSGLIRGTKDCPWSEDIVGRWFAVDEESERVTGSVRRWYEIRSLEANEDGTKDIRIRRFWWGAKEAGSPVLYDPQNHSTADSVRELSYVIAPGTYVYNVSEAVNPNRADRLPGRSTLYITPYRDQGTQFDFAPGDPVEQAIGPEPWRPIPFRTWLWDEIPSPWPESVFDVANWAQIARNCVMSVRGGPATLEECSTKRRDRRPPWGTIIAVESAAGTGIDFQGDVSNAALMFRQPSRPQPIKWRHAGGTASLTVWPQTGDMEFSGGNLSTGGGAILKAKGLSGTAQAASNLRGINVPVPEGQASVTITFRVAEQDAQYAVFVDQNWLCSRAVTSQTAEGFTVQFDGPAPKDARLHWMIVR